MLVRREVGLEYAGISANQFSEEAKKILMGPLDPDDIEIKPDGNVANVVVSEVLLYIVLV